MTPHRLMNPPSTTSTTAIIRGRPSSGRAAPERDHRQEERDEVEREPVAPLDPALREVGEVERRHDHDRGERPDPEPAAPVPPDREQGEQQPGGAQQDARADVDGDRQRARLVEQPAGGARGLARRDRRGVAQRVRDDVGQHPGARAEHDPEVLGHVAQVLDGPLGVIAEGRVAGDLEPVLVVVARVDERAGGEERVAQQRRHGQDTADGGGGRAAEARLAAADEHEERRREEHRQARGHRDPQEQPGEDLRAVEGPRGGPQAGGKPAVGVRVVDGLIGSLWAVLLVVVDQPARRVRRVPVVPERDADGEQRRVRGDQVGEVPGAAHGRRPPPGGPGREHEHRQRAHRQPEREAAEHPPGEPDAGRREPDRDPLLVGREPEHRHERQQHQRREGREGQQRPAVRRAVGQQQRVDVAQVVVLGDVAAGRDGKEDPGAAVEEGVGLPHEVVVQVPVHGVRQGVQQERRQHETDADQPGRRPGHGGVGGGVVDRVAHEGLERTLGYTRRHFKRCVGAPRDRSGFGCARPGHADGRSPPARRAPAGAGRAGDRPDLPADSGICDPGAPRIRVRRGPRAVQLLGRRARRARPVGLLRQRLVRRLHPGLPVRAVGDRGPPRHRVRDRDRRRPSSTASSSCRRSSRTSRSPTSCTRWRSSSGSRRDGR